MKILEDSHGHSSHVRRNFRCAWCGGVMPVLSAALPSEENYGMCSECLNYELNRLGLTRTRSDNVSDSDRLGSLPLVATP